MFRRRPSHAVILFAAVALVPSVAGCLLRNPYLTDATTTSQTVNFATADQSPSPVVAYGPSGDCALSQATATFVATITVGSRTEYQWKTRLTGLNPNTTYCYTVVQGGANQLNGANVTFTTPLAAGDTTPFSFAVFGDWGQGSPDEANVLARVRASGAKFAVTVGDNVYNNGTQTDYGDLTGGNVFPQQYWGPLGNPMPLFAAQGNHGFTQNVAYLQNFPQDTTVATSGGRLRQDSYCCIPAMTSSPKTYASAWYAFDWGNARFYVLEAAWADSNGGYAGDFQAHWNGPVSGCPVCGTQLQWLQADLAAHAGTATKFAFFHYPLHVDSSSQPSDTLLDGPNALEGVLARAGVDVAFNGHAHVYERNRPQIGGTNMVSYVTGGGGGALGRVSGCSSFDAYAIGHASACNAPVPSSDAQVFHYLLVSVNGNRVTVTPTGENGNTFDVQTYTTGP